MRTSTLGSSLALLMASTLGAAADDRSMAVTLGGTAALGDEAGPDLDSAFGGRVALSWELPRLAMPDAPGYNVDVTLVPELLGGTQHGPDRIETMLGAGIRAELRMAQREMGLLRVSARAGFYVAGRASAIGKTRDPQLEIVIGEHLYLGKHSGTRLGIEVGYFERRRDPSAAEMPGMHAPSSGMVAQLYLGFGM